MKNLTNEELEKLLIDTDSFYDCPTEEDKQRKTTEIYTHTSVKHLQKLQLAI